MIEINKILEDYVKGIIDEDLAKSKLCDLSVVSNSFHDDMEKVYWQIDGQFCNECDNGYLNTTEQLLWKMDLIEEVTGIIH